MKRVLALVLALALAACAAPQPVSRIAQLPVTLPPVKAFAQGPAPVTARSNTSIARDFLRLSFQLESGRALPILSRFETPVTVRLVGRQGPGSASRDLDLLLARLRSEAGIRISRVGREDAASISVELIERSALQRAVPSAACFVAPNVTSWREFLDRRNRAEMDWTALTERRIMAVFIPADISSQEIRDCLHEEIAQALGPVNDLYDLRDSVFNDDNFNAVLTGFDMMVLRATYDPALHSGMDRLAVAGRLPGILARIHPAGETAPTEIVANPAPDAWSADIETALGATARSRGRVDAAARAVAIARTFGNRDNRLGFSLYAFGRLVLPTDQVAALRALTEARAIFRADPRTAIHAAHVDAQLAAHALATGRTDIALSLTAAAMPVARAGQNAGLLASLELIRAASLSASGQKAEADKLRLDALGWARYAYVSDAEIRKLVADIDALAPPGRDGAKS